MYFVDVIFLEWTSDAEILLCY